MAIRTSNIAFGNFCHDCFNGIAAFHCLPDGKFLVAAMIEFQDYRISLTAINTGVPLQIFENASTSRLSLLRLSDF